MYLPEPDTGRRIRGVGSELTPNSLGSHLEVTQNSFEDLTEQGHLGAAQAFEERRLADPERVGDGL